MSYDTYLRDLALCESLSPLDSSCILDFYINFTHQESETKCVLNYTCTAESCHKQYGTIPLSDAYLLPFKVIMVLLDMCMDSCTFVFYAEYILHPFCLL